MSKTLIFFGGTFDPPHSEHINMLKSAAEELKPDKIIVMPTLIPPHKETLSLASASDRYEMCRLAFKDIKNAEISDYEIKREGKSYSYLTVEYLKEKYSDYDILFLMGTDMMKSFGKWKNPREILKNCSPLLCARDGEGETAGTTIENFGNEFGIKPLSVSYRGKEISSTEFKIRYMLSCDVSGLVSDRVLDYIKEKGLYKSDKYFDYIKKNLKQSRIEHTAGVVLYALKHCGYYNLNKKQTLLAALLHDAAKYKKAEDYPDFKLSESVPEPVVHQYLGAYIAEKELGITDEEVLDAIRYHTSGKANMSPLGKLIFTADMLENGRTFDGVENLRKIADEDFENGFLKAIEKSYEFVVNSGKPVYGKTEEAIKYYGGIVNGCKTKS